MKGTFTLPEVIDPVDKICVQFQVPNDANHIAAFWGALEALNKAWNWEYTPDHKGSQTAYVCQQYIDDAAEKVNQGIACIVPIDCDELEICLQTSPTIITINNNIATNTTNINNNTTDINLIDNRVTILEGKVTQNETNIANNTTNINQNTVDINLHSVLIQDNYTEIQNNNNELANHEARITALEASQDAQGVLSTTYPQIPLITWQSQSSAFIDSGILQSHTFTYPNATIFCYIRAYNQEQGASSYVRLKANGNVSGEQRSVTSRINSQQMMPISWTVNSMPTGVPTDIIVQFKIDFGVVPIPTVVIPSNQTIFFTIIEYPIPTPIENSRLITFDFGGDAYSLTALNIGVVQAGGNPLDGLAYYGSLGINNHLEVEIDFGKIVTVKTWACDFYCDDISNTVPSVYMDGLFEQNLGSVSSPDSSWVNRSGVVSWVGQVLKFRYSVQVGTVNDIRFDNLAFTFE